MPWRIGRQKSVLRRTWRALLPKDTRFASAKARKWRSSNNKDHNQEPVLDLITPIRDQAESMLLGAVSIIPNLVLALITIILTWIVAKFAVRIANRLVGKTNVRTDLKNLAATLVRVLIWIFGLLIAAAVAIPGFTPAGMIAGLGVGALAIGFAFQDIFENFLAGVLIMLRDKMNIGDYIEADGIDGTVEQITLRETHIRQFSGELTILPNSMIFKNAVKIYSERPQRRFQLMVGVSYDTDLAHAEKVIRAAVEGVATIDPEKGVDVQANAFGGSSLDFLVRWWVNTEENSLFMVHHEVVLAIKKALDEARIDIPFPIVTNMFAEALPVEGKVKQIEPAPA